MKKPYLRISELSAGHVFAVLFAFALLFMQYAYPSIHLTSEFVPADWLLWTMRFVVVLGYLGAWWFGASAIQHLHVYIFTLPESSKTHQSLKLVSRGLLILLVQFVITGTYLKLTRPYALVGPNELQQVHMLANILFTFVPLIGFLVIYRGTTVIKSLLKQRSYSLEYILSYTMILALMIGLTLLVFTDVYRLTPPPLNGFPATFYLTDFWIATAFLFPLFASWFLAIQSVLRILRYADEVSGVIYRKHYKHLSDGLRLTTFTIILTQFTLFASNRLALSGIEYVLVALIILSAMSAYGLWVVARGAKGLIAIETIT